MNYDLTDAKNAHLKLVNDAGISSINICLMLDAMPIDIH